MNETRMIIIPKYCGKCGEPLNDEFICDYCGEETIHPKSAYGRTKNSKEEHSSITKYIKLLVIALFVIFAITTIVKFVSLKEETEPANNSNNLVVAVTDTPTIEITQTPFVISTPAITTNSSLVVVTDTPTPTIKPTPIATKKAKKEVTIRTPEIVVETEKPEPVIVTPNPTVAHTYANSISIPDIIVAKGSTVQLPISISPSNAEYSVTSSNSNIASVSGKSVKGNEVGTATITVTSGFKQATCKVTVTNN